MLVLNAIQDVVDVPTNLGHVLWREEVLGAAEAAYISAKVQKDHL